MQVVTPNESEYTTNKSTNINLLKHLSMKNDQESFENKEEEKFPTSNSVYEQENQAFYTRNIELL